MAQITNLWKSLPPRTRRKRATGGKQRRARRRESRHHRQPQCTHGEGVPAHSTDRQSPPGCNLPPESSLPAARSSASRARRPRGGPRRRACRGRAGPPPPPPRRRTSLPAPRWGQGCMAEGERGQGKGGLGPVDVQQLLWTMLSKMRKRWKRPWEVSIKKNVVSRKQKNTRSGKHVHQTDLGGKVLLGLRIHPWSYVSTK